MPLKILFVLHDTTQSRHFISAYQEMVRRGHEVTLLVFYTGERQLKLPPYLRHIPELKIAPLVFPGGFWGRYGRAFRGARNFLLYAKPRFEGATVFKDRAYGWTDPALRPLLKRPRLAAKFLAAAEEAIPPDTAIMSSLETGGYDAVLVSPYIFYQNTFHNDYVKAAQALGVPVGFPVFSWDNLSTKGLLQIVPDRIWVWNEVQRQELVTLHGAPDDRIGVVGAYRFDDYRALRPSLDRAAFCAEHGLDPQRPIIAYLGSSPAVAPDEGDFVEHWLQVLRQAGGTLSSANVVVRAHPRNLAAWKGAQALLESRPIAFQEPQTSALWDTQALFDLLSHSDAAVGLNTSAMLEAAIHGLPVHSISDPRMSAGQDGTVHFQYLTSAGGGLLYLAPDLATHVDDLARTLEAGLRPDPRAVAFRAAFIDAGQHGRRPTDNLVDEIELLARSTPTPRSRGAFSRMLEPFLRWLVASGRLPVAADPDYAQYYPPSDAAAGG